MKRDEIQKVFDELCNASYEKYQGLAYASGVFQTQLTDALLALPENKAAEFIKITKTLTENLRK